MKVGVAWVRICTLALKLKLEDVSVRRTNYRSPAFIAFTIVICSQQRVTSVQAVFRMGRGESSLDNVGESSKIDDGSD